MVDYADDTLYGEEAQAYINKLKENAEKFLASCGKEPIEIYRIEKFEPVKQALDTHGKFYQGDSYVILKNNHKDYDIHYWHGNEATSDEMGCSAALTVQLSNVLTKSSRHHLEEQAYETDTFLSYFKGGLFYLEGGIESGFKKHNAVEHEPRLMLVKGGRNPRVFPRKMTAESLNEGDCFILDLKEQIFVWHGKEANMFEKNKCMDTAQALKDNDYKGMSKIVHPQTEGGDIEDLFWSKLGGKPSSIAPAVPDDAPSASEDEMMKYALYHISDESGSLKCEEVTERPLKRSHLNDNDSYILELYDQVYVWQGKGASGKEKQSGMKIAKDFIKRNNKPKHTRVCRTPQFAEDATFKSYFEDFYPFIQEDFAADKGMSGGTTQNQDVGKVADQQAKIAQLMFDKLGDNWTKTVYYVENYTKHVKVTDEREEGKFFAETTYLVDIKGSGHQYQITWMGAKLTTEQEAKTSTIWDNINGGVNTSDMTRIAVRKGHEDEAFLKFFPKGFVVLDEARVNWDDYLSKFNSQGALFRVQAPYGGGSRCIEQNERASKYLNSGDSFTVFLPAAQGKIAYIWNGPGSSDSEKNEAAKLADYMGGGFSVQTFAEGQETEEFWASIGGKGDYEHIKSNTNIAPGFDPRLFHLSNATGFMWLKEVVAFGQEDLNNDDIFLLDAYSKIYIWVGNKSNSFEKKAARKKVDSYLAGVKDARDKDGVAIVNVKAGQEPPEFTVQFIQWEPEIAQQWIDDDPERLEEEKKQEEAKAAAIKNDPWNGYLRPEEKSFPYAELKGLWPEGVRHDSKEWYISDAEFPEVMGMTKEEFRKLPKWKQTNKKKEMGLY